MMKAVDDDKLAEEICKWNCSDRYGKTILVGKFSWRDYHFRRIAKLLRELKPPITGLEIRGHHIALIPYENFITGISPGTIDKFSGYMGRRILVVKELDTWPGEEWDLALEAICCGPECDIWEVW